LARCPALRRTLAFIGTIDDGTFRNSLILNTRRAITETDKPDSPDMGIVDVERYTAYGSPMMELVAEAPWRSFTASVDASDTAGTVGSMRHCGQWACPGRIA
jgi:hypothetical protein